MNARAVAVVDMRQVVSAEPERVAAFESRLWEEQAPNEPPLSRRVALWMATRQRPNSTRTSWIVRADDGGTAGVANLRLSTTDNPHLGVVDLRVVPEHRHHGFGRALLHKMGEYAHRVGRTTLITWTWDIVAEGGRFALEVGASAGQVVCRSELDLKTLDGGLVARWHDISRDAQGRYELVEIVGPYPTDQYNAIAEIEAVMDTAPRDGLDVEDHVYDGDWVAQRERQQAEAPGERWTTFARERSTGRFVGFTQVFFYDDWPGHVDQGDTGVHPDHRGCGLGRWLKAGMIDRILLDRPDSKRVWTTNAFSNAPMLAINDELGFVVIAEQTAWQADVASVLLRLGRS